MSFKRFFAVALTVGACASVSAEASAAGDFCIKNGGELIVRKDGNGVDYTVCKLPDGTMIDAEEFYKTGGDLSKFKSVNRQNFIACEIYGSEIP